MCLRNDTKFGKESKRLEYVEENISIVAFMDRFKSLIQPYIHHFILFLQRGKHNNFKHLEIIFHLEPFYQLLTFQETILSFIKRVFNQVTITVQVFYHHARLHLDSIQIRDEA